MDNRCSLWVHERNKVASDRDGCPCRGSSTTEADRVHSISEKEHSRGGFVATQEAEVHAGPPRFPSWQRLLWMQIHQSTAVRV
jgi:hypothetical protein